MRNDANASGQAEVEFIKAACDRAPARLEAEIRTGLEANNPVSLTVRPVMIAECWRWVCLVAERENLTLDEAVAVLLEHGIDADSKQQNARLVAAA